MRDSRWTSLLMLPGGLAVGHAFGYSVAGMWFAEPHGESIGHGYVGVLLRVAVPCIAALVASAFARGARRRQLRRLRWLTLAAQLVAMYIAIELVEHVHSGMSWLDALREPSLLWGVIGQLLAAGGTVLLLRAVHRTGRLLAPASHQRRPRRVLTIRPPAPSDAVVRDVPAQWASRRGPPLSAAVA